jgi:predicted nucleic acid-binding Zn ribbon protein
MERAGSFLGQVVRRIEQPQATFAWLAGSWASVVGRALAAHTRPVRCHDHCLELAADGKAWQSQLECMQHELCARINQAWGGNLVCEVRFVSAPSAARRIPHEADNNYTPFIRRRRA